MPNKLARREPASFTLAPRNLDEAMSFARLIADSDLAPKDFKGKPGNVLVAVQMGAEVGLSPMQAVQTIAVINGRPSMYGDGFLAVIQSSPAYVRHDETFDAATGTATCRIWRKGNPEPHVGTFSRADAQKAGLIGKPGPWTQYERRMLQMRARGFAGRDGFSDALRGIALREEVEDYATIENPAAAELIPMPKATPATATPEAQTVIDTPIERRVSTVGTIHPHMEAKVIDAEGRVVLAGQVPVASDASFYIDLGNLPPTGRFTLSAELIVNGNAMNTEISRFALKGLSDM